MLLMDRLGALGKDSPVTFLAIRSMEIKSNSTPGEFPPVGVRLLLPAGIALVDSANSPSVHTSKPSFYDSSSVKINNDHSPGKSPPAAAPSPPPNWSSSLSRV
ncbi:hypothetical protein GYMLUDRAFT_239492 [Collybiopsis luxurians FD-317 M1]|nr:hypothetical protein GYMLUDRAFT_239492 [Collybiopsis luxurians FD-317 M1]